MQTVGDACRYFNEHLIVGIKLTRPTTSTPGELGPNGEPNAGISNMESPLISMMQIINNLSSSGSQYNSSKNNRSKKSNNVRPPPPTQQ